MSKSMIALSIAAVFSVAPGVTPRSCSMTCNISGHTAMMAGHMGMVSTGTTLGRTTAMNSMSGMESTPTPSASPGLEKLGPHDDAEAEVMLQSMNDKRIQHGGHMTMTMSTPANAADQQRAATILAALRKAITPFKDYRAALAAGYLQFLPQVPQPIYHFTNYRNCFLNEFSFDPARPTSLMYKTVPGGFELVGAMCTAPARSTSGQLNERVPLSVATWHLHTNLCLPPPDKRADMWSRHPQFGLAGSITSANACAQAGGTFKPVVYNWMVHVWPMESDPSKIWASEEHPGTMDR